MDIVRFYTASTAIWLAVQSLALLITPKLVILLLSSSDTHRATDLETYFCRALALALLGLAVLILLLTGSVPQTAGLGEDPSTPSSNPPASSPVQPTPTIILLAAFQGSTAILGYTRYLSTGLSGFALGAFGYGVLAALGIGCAMFGQEAQRISKRTGRDKRTSGWPFGKGVRRGVVMRKGEAGTEADERKTN